MLAGLVYTLLHVGRAGYQQLLAEGKHRVMIHRIVAAPAPLADAIGQLHAAVVIAHAALLSSHCQDHTARHASPPPRSGSRTLHCQLPPHELFAALQASAVKMQLSHKPCTHRAVAKALLSLGCVLHCTNPAGFDACVM
ncbi:hypothetical protein COO60DRAFT_509681 [Scenedesmus sp. NREL 46B-D3]|nr:hypothetical protein COO60DRAFT_509681 [Scenedesmus sp. NREL 46B-D3]